MSIRPDSLGEDLKFTTSAAAIMGRSRHEDSSSSSSSSNSVGGAARGNYSEDETKQEEQDEDKVNAAAICVHKVEDQVMVQLRAYAVLRGHECEYLMIKREMVLGRGAGERSAEDGVVGITENKKVSKKAVRIRYNEKSE